MKLYISEHEKTGGIHVFDYSGGNPYEIQFIELDRPTYFTVSDDKLYAVLRDPFGTMESGMVTFDIAKDGTLYNMSDIVGTNGKSGCHISVNKYGVYIANYRSANICKMPNTLAIHSGSGPNTERQEEAHPHFADITPDGKYIIATDLGTDEVYLYDKDLKELSRCKLPSGVGPRHIAFNKDKKTVYLACELSSEVAILELVGDKFIYKESLKTIPDDFIGQSFPAAIRVAGDYLYVSNRGHNSITVFDIKEKKPKLLGYADSYGENPRDFYIKGDRLVCGNRISGDITFYKIEDGIPKKENIELFVNAPTCIVLTD